MRKLKHLACGGTLLALLNAGIQSINAQDVPACHDMPARQSVLDAGEDCLRHSGVESSNSRLGAEEMGFRPLPLYDQSGATLRGPQYEDPPSETREVLEKLVPYSQATAADALYKAERLERYRQPELARIVFDKLWKVMEAPYLTDDLKARICEGVARTRLMIPSSVYSTKLLPFTNPAQARAYENREKSALKDRSYFGIVKAIKKAGSDQDVLTAEEACKLALKVRNAENQWRETTIIDLMIVGGAEERMGNSAIAFTYYLPAIALAYSAAKPPIYSATDPGVYQSSLKAILAAVKDFGLTDEDRLTALSDLKELTARVPTPQPYLQAIKDETNRLTAYYNKQIQTRQCLDMAEKLEHTAFNLERANQYDMAGKLYQQALEIKQINLGPGNIETVKDMLDVARTAGGQKRFAVSNDLFKKALAAMRANPKTDPTEIVAALESYGQMLNDAKQKAQAEKVYSEARSLILKSKSTIQ